MEINGDVVTVLTKGSAYTELGCKSEADGKALPVKTTGTVDSNTIGVYKIVYSSTNVDGFSAAKTRTVIVLSPDPSTINLEGTFYRGANANVVKRISDRVYVCDNATGYTVGDPNDITLTFYNLDDKKIYAPFTANASKTGLSAESNIGTIVNQNSWNWVIYASGFYGTAVRAFTR
ncbi:immunoglobulin-like domain-containing protein [Flavobacterium sp. 9]|uniref:immunoglobulin-like domain-containing protein n=1 Tax=Flavobacterium sp. 9 TaxID=2035198 RepID=UPI00130436AE|nr:immunoglobulin-like domain-containing protein [Flavobacterium sp. 9]